MTTLASRTRVRAGEAGRLTAGCSDCGDGLLLAPGADVADAHAALDAATRLGRTVVAGPPHLTGGSHWCRPSVAGVGSARGRRGGERVLGTVPTEQSAVSVWPDRPRELPLVVAASLRRCLAGRHRATPGTPGAPAVPVTATAVRPKAVP